jgi:hypothetical protein
MRACVALTMAIAAAPFAIDGRGLTSNDSFAVNASTTLGSTNYFTLQPGASKRFYNGVEVRSAMMKARCSRSFSIRMGDAPCRKANASS